MAEQEKNTSTGGEKIRVGKGWRKWPMILFILALLAMMFFAFGCSGGGQTETAAPLQQIYADIENLESDVASVKSGAAGLTSSLTSLTTRVSNLETSKTAAEERLTNLETAGLPDIDLDEIEASITMMELRLDEIEAAINGSTVPGATPTPTPVPTPTPAPTPAPVALPAAPELFAPVDEAENHKVDNFTFFWQASDNATGYTVVLDGFPGIDTDKLNMPISQILGTGKLTFNTSYTWTVIARNAGGETAAEPFTFTTTAAP